MSMLIPFWVWILVGFVVGWKARGYFGKKFSFLRKVRKPFRPSRKKPPARTEEDPTDPNEPEEEMTGKERVKAAAKKAADTLAKPTEWVVKKLTREDDDE